MMSIILPLFLCNVDRWSTDPFFAGVVQPTKKPIELLIHNDGFSASIFATELFAKIWVELC